MVSDKNLPAPGGEDFSFYLQQVPGCFFLLGTFDAKHPHRTNHKQGYDFNDSMIASAAYLWVRLIEDRFACSILL